MALETGTYIDDLVITNPPGSDAKQQGDDHIRLIKTVLKNTFPAATAAIRATVVPAAKTTTYVVLATDQNAVIRADTSGGAYTITLPANAGIFTAWAVTIVLETGGNDLTIDGDSADTINGEATRLMGTAGHSETYVWTGSEWTVTNNNEQYPIIRTETGTPYVVTRGDRSKLVAVDATAANATVDLPAAATAATGFHVTIKKIDASANTVTVDPSGAETIDGATTIVLASQWDTLDIVCDGTNWLLLASSVVTGVAYTGVLRDSAGRAKMVDPSAAQDIATKNYVDTAGGVGRLILVTLLTTSGTHTMAAATIDAFVELVGGGGGGGGSNLANSKAEGGAGGEYSASFLSAVAATVDYTIGAGGAAGASGGGTGGNGGNTTWDTTVIVANGGTGGQPGAAQTTLGPAGGLGGTGTIRRPGQYGGPSGNDSSFDVSSGYGGASGNGAGQGAPAAIVNTAGSVGELYGGGGSGGHMLSIARAGGAGAAGCIIIREYS